MIKCFHKEILIEVVGMKLKKVKKKISLKTRASLNQINSPRKLLIITVTVNLILYSFIFLVFDHDIEIPGYEHFTIDQPL